MDPQFINVWIYIQIRQVFTTFFLFALFGYYGSMIHYFWGHTVNTGTAMIWIHYFQRVPAGTLWKWWTHYLGYVFVRNKEMDPWFPKSSSRHSLEMMDPLLRLCIWQPYRIGSMISKECQQALFGNHGSTPKFKSGKTWPKKWIHDFQRVPAGTLWIWWIHSTILPNTYPIKWIQDFQIVPAGTLWKWWIHS